MNDRIQDIKQKVEASIEVLKENGIRYGAIDSLLEDSAYLLSEVERLQEENKVMKEALEWTRKRFDEEWTYELGTGEVVDEILTKFDSTLFSLKDKT